MNKLAIIGGTGLTSLKNLKIINRRIVHTPYGEPSAPLIRGSMGGKEVLFLARHGYSHTIPPHKVNYRANIWALKEAGADHIIAVNAVGGIHPAMLPGSIVIPDQLVDYTWGRVNTYFEEGLTHVTHIDFTEPYCAALRRLLIDGARGMAMDVFDGAVYATTQGPRLETAAEVNRLERDGCDLVGMTGMPEAALARELDICYASCAVVANMGAGRGEKIITMEDINRNLSLGMERVRALLEVVAPLV
jgi:5'-deoxy-5'-methylthioadenosine phosphorylase